MPTAQSKTPSTELVSHAGKPEEPHQLPPVLQDMRLTELQADTVQRLLDEPTLEREVKEVPEVDAETFRTLLKRPK